MRATTNPYSCVPHIVLPQSTNEEPRVRSARAVLMGMDDATAIATITKRLEELEWCAARLKESCPIPRDEEFSRQMNRLGDLRAGLLERMQYHTIEMRNALFTA